MKKLLITGFDPFGGESVNPSWEAVKLLPDQIGAYEIHKLQIPTVFGLAPRTVLEKAAEIQPDVIISVGYRVKSQRGVSATASSPRFLDKVIVTMC